MKLSEELKWRGFWNQTTFKDPEILDKEKLTIYLGADPSAEVVNNADWLSKIELIPFLRDIGKNFNMAELISRDFFKSRINNGNGLSFAEFTYTLLQGYDFWYLHKNKGVSLQVGGSDQWGNLISGVNLIRKKEGDEVFAMTAPLLINRSTGRKFGKSEGGALWLDSSKTSPFKLYQFLLNSDDQSVFEYLKILTTLTKEEIESIEQDHLNNPHLRIAQKALAQNVVEIVHGKDNTKNVISATEVLFGGKEFNSLTSEEINILKNELPSTAKDQVITDILVNSETTKSKGEAKRLISGNAISFNGEKIHEDIEINQSGIVKKGKNNFILVL